MSDEAATSEDKGQKRPSPLWLLAGAGALVLGTGSMLAAGQRAGNGAVEPSEPTPALVDTTDVTVSDNRFTVRAPGRIEPRQELTVVGEVQGKVIYVNPDLSLGGRIDEGEVILRIDPGDFEADVSRARAQLATANARLAQAEAERDRQVRLAEIGAAPEKAREAALAGYEDALAAVEQAEAQLTLSSRSENKSVIRAPFDALVVSEDITLGSFVAPGTPLAQLIDAGEGEIVAGLKPADIRAVREAISRQGDSPLTVRAVPNSGSISTRPLEGYLEQFSPVIDPASRTVSVVAVFPDAFSPANDGEIFAGDFMTLEIEAISPAPLFDLPEGAVRQDSFVWVVDDGEVIHRRKVTPIDRREDRVLVASDYISGSDRVMTTILAEEMEGMRVRVAGADS